MLFTFEKIKCKQKKSDEQFNDMGLLDPRYLSM